MDSTRLYTSREIADSQGVSLGTVNRWIKREGLQAEKMGGRWYISSEEFIRFIKQQVDDAVYHQRERAAHSYGQYLIRRRQRGR